MFSLYYKAKKSVKQETTTNTDFNNTNAWKYKPFTNKVSDRVKGK